MKDKGKPILLVLRHHGLGDLLTVQPALRGLRRSFPAHKLTVTCPSWLAPLAHYFGTADEIISETTKGARSRTESDATHHQAVDGSLLENAVAKVSDADIIVSLRTPGPELVDLVEVIKPRLFVSYRYSDLKETLSYPELDFSDHILLRWRRLLNTVGVSIRDEQLYAEMTPPQEQCGFTVIHPGAGSRARLWPVEKWAEVARHLDSLGHQIVFTGCASESDIVKEVRRKAGLPGSMDLAGKTGIMRLANIVSGARLVLSTDTGVSHLATTFRRPAVTLFGPVPPGWWGPPPGNPQHKTLWTGKTGDNYGDEPDSGLREISVASVLQAVTELKEEAS